MRGNRSRPAISPACAAGALRRLAGSGGRLVAQALDLAPGQGDADLADPFQLHPVDRLGVEAREVDRASDDFPRSIVFR